MRRAEDLLAAIAALRPDDLDVWVREELVAPRREAETLVFSEMECARVRLLCTLHYELEVEPDTLPVVVSLLDQLYDTQARLNALSAAIARQEGGIQRAIIAAMQPGPADDPG